MSRRTWRSTVGRFHPSRRQAVIGAIVALVAALVAWVVFVSGAVLGLHQREHGIVGDLTPLHAVEVKMSLASEAPPPAAPTSTKVTPAANTPGVPVSISVPAHGFTDAVVEARGYDPGGVFPYDKNPTKFTWLQDSGSSSPGSNHGTGFLGTHINYGGVQGLLHDLNQYHAGERAVVTLSDGRTITYQVVKPTTRGLDPTFGGTYLTPNQDVYEIPKDVLARHVANGDIISQRVYDQKTCFLIPGTTTCTGELAFVTCGGPFNPNIDGGDYLDNIFVFLQPISATPAKAAS